jgi:hypothetical protein
LAKAKSRPAITDWGTPDPRDKVAYPRCPETSLPQWAWELLRRREDYRKRWDQLNREHGHKAIVGDERTSSISQADAHAALGADKMIRWRSVREVLRQEFRICPSRQNETLDPRETRVPLFEGAEIVYEIETEPEPLKLPQVGILYDVSLSLQPQIDATWKLLAERAREWSSSAPRNVKPPLEKFPTYLRLLDFEAIATTDIEIGSHLFPGKSGEGLRDIINKTSKAARRWQDDYLLIALHSPTGSRALARK